jgi:hypothetical protein
MEVEVAAVTMEVEVAAEAHGGVADLEVSSRAVTSLPVSLSLIVWATVHSSRRKVDRPSRSADPAHDDVPLRSGAGVRGHPRRDLARPWREVAVLGTVCEGTLTRGSRSAIPDPSFLNKPTTNHCTSVLCACRTRHAPCRYSYYTPALTRRAAADFTEPEDRHGARGSGGVFCAHFDYGRLQIRLQTGTRPAPGPPWAGFGSFWWCHHHAPPDTRGAVS